MIRLSLLLLGCMLAVALSLPLARHNFFLSPFKDHFYVDSSSIDPSLLPILANLDPKFANQEYSAVMSAIRDDFKDPKFGQTIDIKGAPTNKKRHYHNSFDVLAGGGLG